MQRVTLNRHDFTNKVLGCWMGKNIGGTLGAPFEWRRQVNAASFYTQELGGEPLPNDDLDIQLLWLIALEEQGVRLDARTLADYWRLHVTPHWSEYGIAKANMASGLMPPYCGTLNNAFKDSCGAFIRSEIWACIAPGCPALAADYACEDAILDHGDGEGTYAEIFCAALESAAFVMSDLNALIKIGLSYIPASCGVAQAIQCAVKAFRTGKTWKAARHEILRQHRGSAFFNRPDRVSPADRRKGFDKGQLGYDAPSNVAILVAALLYGKGDFGKTLCIAVNCGEDTDCTAATAGSIFGILHGIDGIPDRWIEPIGRGIKTVSINVGDLGWQVPKTVDELTERTVRMAEQTLLVHRHRARVHLSHDRPADLGNLNASALQAERKKTGLQARLDGPRFRFNFFDVHLDYGPLPLVRNGEPKTLRVTVHNTSRVQANLNLRWHWPGNCEIDPGMQAALSSVPPWLGAPASATFTLRTERVESACLRGVLELTIEGRPTAMLMPVVLLNGNAQ